MEKIISNVIKAWPRTASVTRWEPTFEKTLDLDYPLSALPVAKEDLEFLSSEKKQELATCLWIQYNRRTIDAEDYIANPAIDWLLREVSLPEKLNRALMQTAIDERYHTYFHSLARDEALARSVIVPDTCRSVTVRELFERLKKEKSAHFRNLIQLAYAAVAEVSVNAFLEVLSTSKEIRESNRVLVSMHNSDERLHSSIFIEIVSYILKNSQESEATYFSNCLKSASFSFLKHDFSMYQGVLNNLGLKFELKIQSNLMTRDMSGVEKLIRRVV